MIMNHFRIDYTVAYSFCPIFNSSHGFWNPFDIQHNKGSFLTRIKYNPCGKYDHNKVIIAFVYPLVLLVFEITSYYPITISIFISDFFTARFNLSFI